jgi:hypothetical protein
MRAALVLVLATAPTLSGCVIDRSPIATGGSSDTGGVADRDATEEPGLDAASMDDAELPDAFATLDARVEPDARANEDAYLVPDAFVPGDAPADCVDETCNRRDDDCDGLVDESGCAVGSEADCAAHQLGDHVYLVCPQLLRWTASRDGCAGVGYALVTIDSGEENTAIVDWIPGDSWIGLHDRDDEGRFVWVDGTEPTFTSWADGEPNDSWVEDCTLLRPSKEWNDSNCNDGHTFVCEAEILPR